MEKLSEDELCPGKSPLYIILMCEQSQIYLYLKAKLVIFCHLLELNGAVLVVSRSRINYHAPPRRLD